MRFHERGLGGNQDFLPLPPNTLSRTLFSALTTHAWSPQERDTAIGARQGVLRPVIGGTGRIDVLRRVGIAVAVRARVEIAGARVGQVGRAAIVADVRAGDALDAAGVGGRGAGGDGDTELEVECEHDAEVVDGVVAVFHRGDEVVGLAGGVGGGLGSGRLDRDGAGAGVDEGACAGR